MFHRIMLATDFSPASDEAARAVVSLAIAYGADVVLLHVVWSVSYDVAFANIPHAEEEARRSAEHRLASLAASMGHAGLHVRPVVKMGNPGDTIAECAREEGADLIVVGSHRHHGLNRLFLGSVADRVVRLAPCHVLTVKSAA